LVAAEDAIRTHGSGVSMEQIAETAEVSKATLYDNFDGKRGLTDALLERYGARLLGEIARGLDQPLTPHQVLRGGIGVFIAVIERDAQLFQFVLSEGASKAMLDESAAPVATLLDSLLRTAGADPRGAGVLARAVLGGIFAAAEHWAAAPTMSRAEFVDHLDALLWPGLAAAGLDRIEGPIDLSDLARLIAEAPAAGEL
jgi:AcrR family transcriptional regulator